MFEKAASVVLDPAVTVLHLRFEPESGLNELLAEWPNLSKRVIPL